jgi:predicted ATPase
MDRIAFLKEHPRIMEDLIEYELTIAETWDDYDDLSEDELRDRAESNVKDIVSSESVDDYYVERAFICFLKDNEKLKGFLSEFLDLNKSSNRIRSRIVAPQYTHRVELVLRHLDYDTIVSPQDVGIGISQVLPVLVHSMAERRKLIAIEQPEIHIHPALQAELGDVFIESAFGENKNCFLLETHSEHLILRILRRIRETAEGELPDGMPPIRPEDVAVLYVKPGEEGAEVIEIPMTEDGDFAQSWPSGFFTERAKELF